MQRLPQNKVMSNLPKAYSIFRFCKRITLSSFLADLAASFLLEGVFEE